ncbi:Octopamine receptor beta-3R [Trachymyrmex septentrionalis]|uniref:Octopamine receptor beta-3R n=1 Tax=Trachymyrmex septentrionalis TaxID=34720 RepID=A0A195F2A7_9HYME|nr:Octopamine receptor beta-3R [Trachymyrmex septentrionalis]
MEVSEPPDEEAYRGILKINFSSSLEGVPLFRNNLSNIDESRNITLIALKGVIMISIIVTALLGNALVIASVRRHRKLRVPTNRYVVSLAMADLLVAMCAMTFNASVELSGGKWLLGSIMCDVWNSMDVYFSTASILHLCCISVDRYYAIVRPLEYPAIMRTVTVTAMLSSAWSLPALISFIPIFMGWRNFQDNPTSFMQLKMLRLLQSQICMFVVNLPYAVISSCVSFWIPGVVMIVMYCKIYKEAVRQRAALSRASSSTVLNNVHVRRSSGGSRHHSRTSHQLLLHPSDASDYGRPPSYRASAAELNIENASSKLTFFKKFIKYLTKTFDTCGNRDQYFMFHLAERILFHKQNTETYQLLVMVAIAFTEEYCGHTTASLQAIWLRQIAINLYVDITCVRVVNANHDRHCSKPQIEMISQPCTSIRQQTKSWRAEHKAARTLGIIMGAFLLCWLPFFLWYLTTSLCGEACYCPDTVVSVLFWIGYFNSALNPLIYAYFNRDFRDAFKDTLKSALPCCANCWKTPSQFV